MRTLSFLSLLAAGMFATAPVQAGTTTVVTFNSEEGLILLDSMQSQLPYRLFEALNAPVENEFLVQRKVYQSAGNEFRIACAALSADYTCTVVVYPGRHAALDFDTDAIALRLPATIADTYGAALSPDGSPVEIRSEDGRFTLTWAPGDMLKITGIPPVDRLERIVSN